MLNCNGFKMFHGTVTITPKGGMEPFDMTGTWLFNPDKDIWFCKQDGKRWSVSIESSIMSDIRDDAA